ncbi:thioredoxin family protein [Pseudorhodoferax sp. Leaf267]|uniref:thioredoxin family protein n=1 Tax=Pseudorhodoferax sp. Leaf267 TaxID=1736316 RepID=UPI0006F7CC7F|nr:thioredoxin family protein [Pseudorhodoferax sp. Leaf267]KQP17656.1 thioredoxin [Pseudorhodoferax sp. Leaf267]
MSSKPYTSAEPSRSEVDAMRGPVLLEFGDAFCGFCRAAQPAIERALQEQPEVTHLKIADGRGRPLGRSFGVKLWPTLVFLQDGREVERLVRPVDHHPVAKALSALKAA